ncbi:hypothetical protein ACW73L_07565 [Methylolobus aquaticus]
MPVYTYDNDSYFDVAQFDGIYPLGNDDSTDGLNAAIAYGAANNIAPWIPNGVQFMATEVSMMSPHKATNQGWNNRRRLMGEARGTRPIIQMIDGAAPSAGSAKALIRVGSYASGNVVTTEESRSFYGAILRNLDLRIGSGNGKGIVLHANVAQHCSFENLRITATGGYVGLVGGAGPGAILYDVEIVGGQYGIWNERMLGTNQNGSSYHYRLVTLDGQSVNAIYHFGYRGATFDGIRILNAPPVAIMQGNQLTPMRGVITLRDVSCIWADAPGTFIQNTEEDKGTALVNVYLQNCGKVIETQNPANSAEATDVAGTPGSIIRVDGVYVPGTSWTALSTNGLASTMASVALVNGTRTAGTVQGIVPVSAGSIPSNLYTRWRRQIDRMDFATPGVIDMLARGIVANDPAQAESNYAKIQAALDEAGQASIETGVAIGIKFPKGQIYVSEQPQQWGDVQSFGVPGGLTRIMATASWQAASATDLDWIWRVGRGDSDDQYAQTWVYDLVFDYPTTTWNGAVTSHTLGALHWTAGANSGSMDIKFGSWSATGELKPRKSYFFEGSGGDHACLVDHSQAMPNNAGLIHAGYVKFHFKDCINLRVGMLDPEHGGISEFSNNPFFIIEDSIIDIGCLKTETVGTAGRIIGDSDVVIGYTGGYSPGGGTDFASSLLEVESPAKVTAYHVIYPPPTVGAYGKVIDEIGFGTPDVCLRTDQITRYERRPSGTFDRDALFVYPSRPTPSSPDADPLALSSRIWYVYLEGSEPDDTDFAVAELDVMESANGPSLIGDATVTVSAGGSNVGNLTDGLTATDMTATQKVVIKIEFASAKALKRILLTSSAAAGVPIAAEVYARLEGTTRDVRVLRRLFRSWSAGETKQLLGNRRSRSLGISGRARATIASI